MTRSNNSLGRAGAKAAGVAVLAAAALGLGTTAAQADPPTPESPAVVGPLLQILTFGVDVGVPTGCQAGTAAMGSAAAYLGQAQQLGSYIAAVNSACDTAQLQADTYIAAGKAQDGPLAAWNPVVNPVLQQTADSTTQAGTTYGGAVAPFGPTIAGLGATINFFQGH